MATYGQQAQTEDKQPRTDYTNLLHNGKKYDNLDEMVLRIAKERSNTAFKSTKLILAQLKVKKTDQEVADAMIEANKNMILSYIEEKKTSRDMFGL